MASFKLPDQFFNIAPGKDARALINDYRSGKKPDDAVAAQSLQNLQEAIDALRRNMGETMAYFAYLIQQGAIGPAPTPATGPTITCTDITLSAASTLITATSATAAGDLLFLFLIQDATGGRLITWDTNLKWAPVDIAPIASTVTMVPFVSRVDPADSSAINWFYVPLLSTGNIP